MFPIVSKEFGTRSLDCKPQQTLIFCGENVCFLGYWISVLLDVWIKPIKFSNWWRMDYIFCCINDSILCDGNIDACCRSHVSFDICLGINLLNRIDATFICYLIDLNSNTCSHEKAHRVFAASLK